MSSDHENGAVTPDDTKKHSAHTKVPIQSEIEEGEVLDEFSYTEEENRRLVRKLDWHVSSDYLPLHP